MSEHTAELDALTWEVFDMAHEHQLCLDDKHGAEFGPMSKADALAMETRNPRGYWAREIPRNTPASGGDA